MDTLPDDVFRLLVATMLADANGCCYLGRFARVNKRAAVAIDADAVEERLRAALVATLRSLVRGERGAGGVQHMCDGVMLRLAEPDWARALRWLPSSCRYQPLSSTAELIAHRGADDGDDARTPRRALFESLLPAGDRDLLARHFAPVTCASYWSYWTVRRDGVGAGVWRCVVSARTSTVLYDEPWYALARRVAIALLWIARVMRAGDPNNRRRLVARLRRAHMYEVQLA